MWLVSQANCSRSVQMVLGSGASRLSTPQLVHVLVLVGAICVVMFVVRWRRPPFQAVRKIWNRLKAGLDGLSERCISSVPLSASCDHGAVHFNSQRVSACAHVRHCTCDVSTRAGGSSLSLVGRRSSAQRSRSSRAWRFIRAGPGMRQFGRVVAPGASP